MQPQIVELPSGQQLEVDQTAWRTVWSANVSHPQGQIYTTWTANLLQDDARRSLVYVICEQPGIDSHAYGELGQPESSDLSAILKRCASRAGLDELPPTWTPPAQQALKNAE